MDDFGPANPQTLRQPNLIYDPHKSFCHPKIPIVILAQSFLFATMATWPEAREWIPDRMREVCSAHGGPMQYLAETYNTPELQSTFVQQLRSQMPPDEQVHEHLRATHHDDWLNKVELETPYCAHISMLSYFRCASTKPPPYRTVTLPWLMSSQRTHVLRRPTHSSSTPWLQTKQDPAKGQS